MIFIENIYRWIIFLVFSKIDIKIKSKLGLQLLCCHSDYLLMFTFFITLIRATDINILHASSGVKLVNIYVLKHFKQWASFIDCS